MRQLQPLNKCVFPKRFDAHALVCSPFWSSVQKTDELFHVLYEWILMQLMCLSLHSLFAFLSAVMSEGGDPERGGWMSNNVEPPPHAMGNLSRFSLFPITLAMRAQNLHDFSIRFKSDNASHLEITYFIHLCMCAYANTIFKRWSHHELESCCVKS